MVDWGLLRYPDVLLQSAFGDFLHRCLDEKTEWRDVIEMAFEEYYDKVLKSEAVTQVEMSNQNNVKTSTVESTLSMPTHKSSINLYNRLKQLPKPLFNEICFYLKEKHEYDLSFIDVNGVPADAAHQLIEFLKQYSQGLNDLQQLLEERRLF